MTTTELVVIIWAVLVFLTLASTHAVIAGIRQERARRAAMRRHPLWGVNRRQP